MAKKGVAVIATLTILFLLACLFTMPQERILLISPQTLEWGDMNAGQTVNRTIQIRNLQNQSYILRISTYSFEPVKLQDSFQLMHNYTGTPLEAYQIITVLLILQCSRNITIGPNPIDFSLNINVEATPT